MLNFTKHQVDINTLLANTTALAGFTPNRLTNNSLEINEKGQIQVTTREVTPPDVYELFKKLSLNHSEKQDAFAQEKMILIWHFSQLLPYLEQRLETLKGMSKNNLLEYHDYAMRLQGFYQLCNNLILQLYSFNQLMGEVENPQKQFWSRQFNLLQQCLSQDLDGAIRAAKNFIDQIAFQRKNQTTNNEPQMEAHQLGPIVHIVPSVRSVPTRYTLGNVTFEEHTYHVTAHFESYREAWKTPTRFPFSGKLCIDIQERGIPICATLKVYPSWTYGETPEPKPSKTIDFPADCAHNKLKILYEVQRDGVVALQPVTLRASFSHLCPHTKSYQLLPYFVTLVDIAKSERISEITVFAPYDYSAIMYAFGFYIADNDLHSPTVGEQSEFVNACMAQGKKVAVMNQRFNRHTADENPDPILRPFCLSLSDLDSRPVFLTKFRRKTTYNALLAEAKVIDPAVYPRGVFPEVLQIPLRFSGSIPSFLRRRELSGNVAIPAVSYGLRKVDYQAFGKDDALQNYAFADPAATQQSGYQQMLTLKRK